MDWIKIRTQHILFADLSLTEIGALVKIQGLTAQLERIPSQKEITKHVPEMTFKRLTDKLHTSCTTLTEVLRKVCEDVTRVATKRVQGVRRVAAHRASKVVLDECNALHGVTDNAPSNADVTRQIREEEIREEKEVVLNNLNIKNNLSKADDDSKKIMSSSAFEKILETREAFKHKGMEAIDASTKEMILTVYAITKAKENVSGYLNQVKDNLEKGEGNFELIFLDVANFSRRELKKIKSSEVIVQSQNEQSNQEAGIQSYKDKLKKASQVLNNLPLDARESLRVKVADEYGQLANDLSKDTIERCMLETIIEKGI